MTRESKTNPKLFSELRFYQRLSSDNAELVQSDNKASDVREIRMQSGQAGLAAGSFVLNRITGVHAYVMVVYRDAPYVKVLRLPEDAPNSAPWQTWPVHEAERILKGGESNGVKAVSLTQIPITPPTANSVDLL